MISIIYHSFFLIFSRFFFAPRSLSLSFVFSLAPFTSFLYVALPFLRHVFLTPEKWCKYVERWLCQAISKNGWLNDITIVRVHVHTRVMSEHPTKLTRKKCGVCLSWLSRVKKKTYALCYYCHVVTHPMQVYLPNICIFYARTCKFPSNNYKQNCCCVFFSSSFYVYLKSGLLCMPFFFMAFTLYALVN